MDSRDRLIVALDVDSEEKAVKIVKDLRNCVKFFKVGLELFSSCGPAVIEGIVKTGCGVFLDLKLHDIPNTVAKTAASITKLGVTMFNVHSLGGYDMMKKTADSIKRESEMLGIARPKVIAVTILTSMDEKSLEKVGISGNIKARVLELAGLAREAGLDGVVASPAEAEAIRNNFGTNFLIVTPGVRPDWAAANDQKRIATPREAVARGADYIVVGRPIIDSSDPVTAARKVLQEII